MITEHEGTYEDLVKDLRKYGQILFGGYDRVIFTNGCFDLLHVGHLEVLAKCRSLAGSRGAVVVGLNSDNSVKKLKGESRPIMTENERGKILASLKYVDHVLIFEEETPLELIKILRPNVIVKGGDYEKLDVVGSDLAPVVLSSIVSGQTTSGIIVRIRALPDDVVRI